MNKLAELKAKIETLDDDADMIQEYIDECADLTDEELQLEFEDNCASYFLYKQFAQEEYKK